MLFTMQALLTKPENKLFPIARMHTNQFNCSEDWKKSPDLAYIYYSKHGKVYCGRCENLFALVAGRMSVLIHN